MKRKVLLDTRHNKNSWLPTQNTNPETQYKAFIYIYIYIYPHKTDNRSTRRGRERQPARGALRKLKNWAGYKRDL